MQSFKLSFFKFTTNANIAFILIILMLACLHMLPTKVYAGDLAIVDGDGKKNNLVELEMSSIQQFATIAKAWVKVTHPKPVALLQGSNDKYNSVVYRMIIDCANARYVFSNTTLYSQARGRGEVLGSTKISEREAVYQMKDIAPDTVASAILHYACYIPSAK